MNSNFNIFKGKSFSKEEELFDAINKLAQEVIEIKKGISEYQKEAEKEFDENADGQKTVQIIETKPEPLKQEPEELKQETGKHAETKCEIQSATVDFTPVVEKLAAVDKKLGELQNCIQDFTYKDKINKDLHEELQKYKDGIKESFISPLLKSIVREYDNNVKQYQAYLSRSAAAPQTELFGSLLKELQMTAESMLILLSDYNLEPFSFEEGEAFSSTGGEQKITEVIETADRAKDGKVAACTACGFKNVETGKIFRKAEVKIYKIK